MTETAKKISGSLENPEKNSRNLIAPAIGTCRILVIDDDELIRSFISLFLHRAGFSNVAFAENGAEGLEKVESFNPDIVLLDVQMPEMDGFEVLRRLRADPRHQDLPIFMETALDSLEDRNRALAEGATNLINKPIDGDVLVTGIRLQLENRVLMRQLKDYRERLDQELSSAQAMQHELMPSPDAVSEIETRYGVSLQSHYRTSSELGGDFWGVCPLDDDHFSVFNVDFSGHGVGAAINTFRLHTLMKERKLKKCSAPSEHMAELNRHLATLMPTGQFATMFLGIVDIRADKIIYSGAAAPSPILMTPGSDEPVFLDASGLPLGISGTASYKDKVVDFPAGSALFLFSDALFESPGKDGGILQLKGVPGLVKDSLKETGRADPLPRILDRFYDRATLPLDDDLTAVWLSR